MKDPALSMCSPATRGIWMDLLCAIHELDHAGQVTGTPEQLSRLCRCGVVEFVDAFKEFRASSVADVTERNGIVTVISRRMKRDNIEREKTNERVKKHRCNGFVTDNETRMKQDSSSSSSSSKEKEQQAAPKKAPPLSQENLGQEGIPDSVSQLIDDLIASRSQSGAEIRSIPGMKARLRQAWRDNPGEADIWKSEIAENVKRYEKQMAAAIAKANETSKKLDDEAEIEADRKRRQSILSRFDSLEPEERSRLLYQAKSVAGCEFGPDTPLLYASEIESILDVRYGKNDHGGIQA